MKVFLTGATGYIGSAVTEALQRAGHSVFSLARSGTSAAKLRKLNVETRMGTLNDEEGVSLACREADGVIHLASPGGPGSESLDLSFLEAALDELEGTHKPFIYTSGVWVLGDTGGRAADETAPLSPPAIVAWRPAMEKRVLDAVPDEVRSIVIRPALVYGRSGGLPAMLVGSARQKPSPGSVKYIGDGKNRWPMVYLEDLADLYLRAFKSAPAGTVLHGASGESVAVRDAALAASEAAGVPGKIVSVPLEEARKALGPLADALVLDQQVSGALARRLLDWQPSGPSFLDDLRDGSYAIARRVKAN